MTELEELTRIRKLLQILVRLHEDLTKGSYSDPQLEKVEVLDAK